MPLVLMCGYPCSGKTRRAEELKNYFEQNTERKVHVVGDGTMRIEKNTVYADSQSEKNVRGALRAEVERKVTKDDIVILDSLNYIKGYRYELYCIIKHTQTPHCLVYCLTSAEVSSTWNTNRHATEQYTQEILDALVLRFEAPDSRNRWDSPLFTIQKEDTLPFEAISDAIFKRKAPPPNQSTQSQPLSSTNFLYELDKLTQDVLMCISSLLMELGYITHLHPVFMLSQVRKYPELSLYWTHRDEVDINLLVCLWAILNAQKTSVPGDRIVVPGTTERIELTRSFNMAELRKLRRQFISYTKMHPTENTGQISNMFVQYLNKSFH